MIDIKPNNYQQPTEVREEVVQDICNAFLSDCVWSTFHPFGDGYCRCRTHYVLKRKSDNKAYGFGSSSDQFSFEYGVKFHGCEMERAFQELIKAGYFMFKVYSHDTWMGYRCSRVPVYEGGTRVYEFNDVID